jgi:pyruvate formate lyase activating enzyme
MQEEASGMIPECTRRRFLGGSLGAAAACLVPLGARDAGSAPRQDGAPARHYQKLAGGKVQCGLCPWACVVDPGKRGRCGVRENRGGEYRSLVYGRVAASHVDPIEKKPFFHFLPGRSAYSIATVGCNLTCKFCQNWDLSQRRPEDTDVPETTAASVADEARRSGCSILAYTYNEPTVFNEFVFDTASAGRPLGLKSAVVSNGFIQAGPLDELASVIDGYKVDLKSFGDAYYQKVCGGRLGPVLDTLVRLKRDRVWCEVVVLLVPTLNDGEEELRALSRWIAREMGPDVPLHFSRFVPQYKLRNLPPTPVSTLERAWGTARDAGLNYVYLGNLPGHPAENTTCPSCGETLLRRTGFLLLENRLRNGRCGKCSRVIPGVWT